MAETDYRSQQEARRYDAHVEPLNCFVDDIRDNDGRGWAPYVGPDYGGVGAHAILLFQDPGPMTNDNLSGSGFMSFQNADPSAQVLCECMEVAGLTGDKVVSWNVYPWYTHGAKPTSWDAGFSVLARFIDLLPHASAIYLGGKVAQDAWKRFRPRYPTQARRLSPFPSFHTSGLGITNGSRQSKQVGIAHVTRTLGEMRAYIEDAEPA